MELQKEFENRIGYQFQNKKLLKQALIHSSYANERHLGKNADNERLEFLGGAGSGYQRLFISQVSKTPGRGTHDAARQYGL